MEEKQTVVIKEFQIEEPMLAGLIQYLSRQPHKEVVQAIQILQGSTLLRPQMLDENNRLISHRMFAISEANVIGISNYLQEKAYAETNELLVMLQGLPLAPPVPAEAAAE